MKNTLELGVQGHTLRGPDFFCITKLHEAASKGLYHHLRYHSERILDINIVLHNLQ